MTLRCECGSYALEIESQSYSDTGAFEKYECETCGSIGTLTIDCTAGGPRERYGGCLESDV